MITFKKAELHHPEIMKIERLYLKAFPKNERRPLKALLTDKTNTSEVLAIYMEDEFVGFMSLLTRDDTTHIIYFAIEEAYRDKGLGTQILNQLHDYKKNNRLLVDIEIQDEKSANHLQRKKRKSFYLKNGYKETNITYNWHHQTFEVLVYGNNITEKELKSFWQEIYTINDKFIGY